MTCPNCDRADCPLFRLTGGGSGHEPIIGGCSHGNRYEADCETCYTIRVVASNDCRAHAVDWRTRALAAEARIANALEECERQAAHSDLTKRLRGENADLGIGVKTIRAILEGK